LLKMPGIGGYHQILSMPSSFRLQVYKEWAKDLDRAAKKQTSSLDTLF
jgi:hypothetical protein